MNDKSKYNPNIHHRRSIRLKGYDYSQAGLYFITICCQDRACLFGEITNGEMVLNEYGKIAQNEWMKTPEIRINVELGEFIIMPNHIHGIIRLLGRGELHSPNNETSNDNTGECNSHNNTGECNSQKNTGECNSQNNTGECNSQKNTGKCNSQNNETSNDNTGECNSQKNTGECNSPLRGTSNTIGAIIRGYKSSVTKQLNLMDIGCVVWQRNYHEHIIRDEQSYQTISNYIITNPAKWSQDKFYTQ